MFQLTLAAVLGLCAGGESVAKPSVASGMAIDQEGLPVAGVVIFDDAGGRHIAPSFRPPGQHVLGITDPKGHWTLTNAPDWLVFAHPEFVREIVPSASQMVLLRPGSTVRGKVINESARSLEGVRILGGDFPLWTPADGGFELRNCRTGPLVLVAEAPGHAASWTELTVAGREVSLRWVLPPAVTNRLRVVDSSNRAIPHAEVAVEQWEAPIPWDWRWRTDTNGLVVWANAPTGEVRCVVTKMGFRARHDVRLMPAQAELLVILHQERTITGFVCDQARHALEDFSVEVIDPSSESPAWHSAGFRPGTREGEFVLPLPGETPAFVRVGAIGWEGVVSRRIEAGEENVALEFRLPRAEILKGAVRDENGKPVSSAQIVWANAERKALLARGSFLGSTFTNGITSDKIGSFEVQIPVGAAWVFAAKPELGFAAAPVEELRRSMTLTLQPWGHLTGRVEFNGKAQSHRLVALSSVSFTNLVFYQNAFTKLTDEAGRFAFDYVPAERQRVGLIVRGFLSHAVDAEVKPGRDYSLLIGGTGARVLGRLRVPGAEPPTEDATAPAGLRDLEKRTGVFYEFEFDEHGAFHVECVPPGRYELEAHWHEYDATNNQEICHGPWRTNVIVPAQAEVDLGDFFWKKPGRE